MSLRRISPSHDFVETVGTLDVVSVLHGPFNDPGRVVIDPCMGHDFREIHAEYLRVHGPGAGPERPFSGDLLAEIPGVARILASNDAQGMNLGTIALTPGKDDPPQMLGLFHGPDLCVRPSSRGRGIGHALVLTRMLIEEGLPTWDHDKPGYTPAGARVVCGVVADLQAICAWSSGKHPDRPAIVNDLKLAVSHSATEEPSCP